MVFLAGFFSVNQLHFVANKYNCFFNDFNQQLWENHTADESITLCYFLTIICLIFAIIGFSKRLFKSTLITITLRFLLTVFFIISFIASIWMFDMHSKKMVIGYNEWIRHGKESSVKE